MSHRMHLNPIACEAHGMCAELFPERIELDEWGYPMIDSEPIPAALLAHARRAAQACPTFALLLERDSSAEEPDRGLKRRALSETRGSPR